MPKDFIHVDPMTLRHVKRYAKGELTSTIDGKRILELPDGYKTNFAANQYISVLGTIKKLLDGLGLQELYMSIDIEEG